jgi:hypothetical membrane protein
VSASRYRWGGLAWLLTLQFFVVETIAQVRFGPSYSRLADTISLLGSTASPAAVLMNASFVLQAVLIGAGAYLLAPGLSGLGGRLTPFLLAVPALGVLGVGVFRLDTASALHSAGTILYLVGSVLALVALAYGVRPRSEAVGTTIAVLALLSFAATVFYGVGAVDLLGSGGTERAAAYPLPIGLALAGVLLWRQKDSWAAPGRDGRPSRRELQERARAERAERERQRDEALERAARRAEEARTAPRPAAEPGGDAAGDDDFDPDDPWASPGRR